MQGVSSVEGGVVESKESEDDSAATWRMLAGNEVSRKLIVVAGHGGSGCVALSHQLAGRLSSWMGSRGAIRHACVDLAAIAASASEASDENLKTQLLNQVHRTLALMAPLGPASHSAAADVLVVALLPTCAFHIPFVDLLAALSVSCGAELSGVICVANTLSLSHEFHEDSLKSTYMLQY